MRVKKIEIIPLILLYLNIILIFQLLGKCYLIYDIDYIYITILFLICIVAVSVYHFVLDKALYKVIAIVSVAALFGISFLIRGESLYDVYYTNYVFNFNAISDAVNNGTETYFTQYQPFILLFLPVILIIITFIYNRGFRNFILLIDLVYIIILWFVGYSDKVTASLYNIVFVTVATYAAHLYYKDIQKNEAKGIRIGKSNWTSMFYIIVMAIVIACITRVMPQSYTGKYGSVINSYFKNAYAVDDNSKYSLRNVYDLTLSGFDENNRKLGGPITPDGGIVFRVQSGELYYLRGVAKDYYDGSMWKKTNNDFKKFSNTDDSAMRQRIIDYINHSGLNINFDLENSISTKTISVFPDAFKTSTLFTPLNIASIGAGGNIMTDRDKTFLSGLGTNVDYNYNESFCESPISTDNFPDLYKKKTSGNIIDYTDITQEENYKNYEDYMQVPDNISDRTKKLVQSIIAGCTTNDEKVFKIQQYLSKNYPYSLDVSPVPDKAEFIDYFLYTEKKGYCTYFATTTTIFCRLAGIPARYVEGFHMAEDKDDEGRYLITNDKAHAWTEVLVSPQYNLWATVDCVPDAYEEIKKSNLNSGKNTKPSDLNKPGSNNNDPDAKNSLKNKNSKTGNNLIQNKTFIILSIMILLLICIITRILFIESKKTRLIKSRSIIPVYKHSLKRLRHAKIVKNKEDTELEFARKLVNPELKSKLLEIVPVIYGEYYGNKLPEGNKIDKKAFNKFIEKYIRERQNLLIYLLEKFFTY